MLSQKYEVEHVQATEPEKECAALIAMLTGLPLEEVWAKLPARLQKHCGWYSRDFSDTFRRLGYDCSPRFIKFDPDTKYPCLLRFGPTARGLVWRRAWKRRETGDPTAQLTEREKHWWNVWVYYDGLVYEPRYSGPWLFHTMDKGVRPTSMMQVWISDL